MIRKIVIINFLINKTYNLRIIKMNQDIDSDFQNSLKEDLNLFDFHDDSDLFLSNDNIGPSLDFNSPNYQPINLGNFFTQPTSSFPTNNDISSPFKNNANKGNNQKEEKKEKKILGRKRKNSINKGLHTKFSSDNIIRKIKSHLIKFLLNEINIEINKTYNGKFSKDIYKKYLLKINQDEILKSGNKAFLNQTLEVIFSNNISSIYKKNYQSSHNKKIISDLINEKDEQKRKKFSDLFKLTFLDCLKHFRESDYHKELEGLTTLKNALNNMKEGPEYKKLFKHYVEHFEEVIKRIKEKK